MARKRQFVAVVNDQSLRPVEAHAAILTPHAECVVDVRRVADEYIGEVLVPRVRRLHRKSVRKLMLHGDLQAVVIRNPVEIRGLEANRLVAYVRYAVLYICCGVAGASRADSIRIVAGGY